MSTWIFGYGSLIWRPDFRYQMRRRARLTGWQRRFWQGSHDHRGVPEQPGRVVTLVPAPVGHCDGMAYLVEPDAADAVFEALDHREKNGYLRQPVSLAFPDHPADSSGAGVVYLATPDNHAYLGPAPLPDMVRQIVTCIGPSGRNLDYLLELAEALRRLNADDPHVFELEAAAMSYSP